MSAPCLKPCFRIPLCSTRRTDPRRFVSGYLPNLEFVSLNDDTDADVTTLPMPSEAGFSNITPLPRQAFLLLSLEGFFGRGSGVRPRHPRSPRPGNSPIPPAVKWRREIATDVLIIEDETFIAMDLESLVKNLGHNVIGVARTHSDAVALARTRSRA